MAEITTNSQVQTDPKLQDFKNKISSLQEQLNLVSSYVTAYNNNGMFNMSGVISDIKDKSVDVFVEGVLIRNKEEGHSNENYGTYVKIVRDPEKIIKAISPREFTISDIVYVQYTEGYNTEDKQKEKNAAGKTPKDIYKTVKRGLENSSYYIVLKDNWKDWCKTYKLWLKNIDKFEKLEKEIATTKEKEQQYIKSKETKTRDAQATATNKFNIAKEKENFEETIQQYTNKAKEILSWKSADVYFINLYNGPNELLEIYEGMGLGLSGTKRKSEIEKFNSLTTLANELIETANQTRTDYEDAFQKDKNAKPDYTNIKNKYNQWKALYDPFYNEISLNKVDAETRFSKLVQENRKNANNASDEVKKEESKTSLDDNISDETKQNISDRRGKGTLEGGTGSPEASSPPGKISTADMTEAVVEGFEKQSEQQEEQKQEPNKYLDEDLWTDDNEKKLKSQKSGLTEEQQEAVETDMKTVLANVATNIVGAVLTDPSLAQTVNGMASTGTFDLQSLEGTGNALLASSVNTLSNAMMNVLGVGAVEEIMDDAFRATTTIVTTATNIVPTIKELTVATVTTVADELTSHVIEKVENILDPTAITTQITYFSSYYIQLYTKGADDLKKTLLSPADAAFEDALNTKNEESKNEKMQNMTVKLTELKQKVEDGVALAKSGVKMVTTYINNGPDWVIKQLSTYTNFAISQAEKYIDYGADYVIDQRDMWIATTGETIGKRIAEKSNKILEQTLKKAIDYIEVKKKYVTQVAMAAIMTAVQIVVGKLGPLVGTALKAAAKMGMKQLLKTIGG